MSEDPSVSPRNFKIAMELEAVYTLNRKRSRSAEAPRTSSATPLDENHEPKDPQIDISKEFSKMREALNGLVPQGSDEFQKPHGRWSYSEKMELRDCPKKQNPQ